MSISRAATATALMQPVVADLSVEDMLYLSAYTASLPVPPSVTASD